MSTKLLIFNEHDAVIDFEQMTLITCADSPSARLVQDVKKLRGTKIFEQMLERISM